MSLAEDMSRLTHHLAQAHEARVGAVREIAAMAAGNLTNLCRERGSLAHEQRERIAEFTGSLRREIGALMKEADNGLTAMGAARRAMAAAQGKRLARLAKGLRRDVGALLDEAGSGRAAMAAEQHQRLEQYLDALRGDVTALRREAAAMCRSLHGGRAEARKAWRRLTRTTRRAKRPAEPAPADDLTVIRGIGASMRQRLNRAGITTFAELAAKSPAELRRILGGVGRLADVEGWIKQARARATKR